MLRRGRWILLGTLLVGCGGSLARTTGEPTKKSSEPALSSEWAIAYRRHCEGTLTPPVIAPGRNGQVAFCNARFDVEHGRFRGPVDLGLLAFVDDARGIFFGYGDGGLRLGRTVKGVSQDTLAESEGGSPEAAVLSPRRTEVVSFEQAKDRSGALVVRELPSLRTVRRTPVPRTTSPLTIGWLADGREVVFGSLDACSPRDCPSTLLAVDRGSLAPVSAIFADATSIALDARGERAAIATRDGLRIVALPSGETITEVDKPPQDIKQIAISDDGKRVSVASAHAIAIFGPSPRSSTLRREHEAALAAETIQFSPDAKTLFVGQGTMMVALRIRNGQAASQPPPTMTYAPHLPPTFEAARRNPAAEGTLDTFAFGGDSRGEPGLFAWYRKRDHSVYVVASSFEASELDDVKELEQWGRLIALRFGMTEAIGAPGWRVWQDDKQRSVTMVRRVREGCDPHDAWVRFTERDGMLYRISVDTAPGTSAKIVEPLARTFLLEPFGDHQAVKLSFKLPRVPWLPGPC
jgi:hypothetical protein